MQADSMIDFKNLNQEIPFLKFKQKYDEAISAYQENIEAISISSYSKISNEVNSRYVNLKIVDNKNFIFFSNYKSPKSADFSGHNQINALIFWNKINTQIRIKARIKKTSQKFNNIFFSKRSESKNALAISSSQSSIIDSYKSVVENYEKSLKVDNLKECPDFWGGFSFEPYYFEFWEGHDSRINRRNVYESVDGHWNQYNIQP
jgi:pyridoxamine 5'-phosphate oxidase